MSDKAAFRAVVRGRVQMVGFRWFTVDAAQGHGVEGWVRNLIDGSVEVEASGPRPALEAFLEDLHRGPISSRVTGVDIRWLTSLPVHHGFQIAR